MFRHQGGTFELFLLVAKDHPGSLGRVPSSWIEDLSEVFATDEVGTSRIDRRGCA